MAQKRFTEEQKAFALRRAAPIGRPDPLSCSCLSVLFNLGGS